MSADLFAGVTGLNELLIRAAPAVAAAWRPALADSWRMGHEVGYRKRHAAAERQMAEAWSHAVIPVERALELPAQEELERRRRIDHAPCPTRCRACSRCIHSLAYWARGGRDFLGVEQEAALARNRAGARARASG